MTEIYEMTERNCCPLGGMWGKMTVILCVFVKVAIRLGYGRFIEQEIG